MRIELVEKLSNQFYAPSLPKSKLGNRSQDIASSPNSQQIRMLQKEKGPYNHITTQASSPSGGIKISN